MRICSNHTRLSSALRSVHLLAATQECARNGGRSSRACLNQYCIRGLRRTSDVTIYQVLAAAVQASPVYLDLTPRSAALISRLLQTAQTRWVPEVLFRLPWFAFIGHPVCEKFYRQSTRMRWSFGLCRQRISDAARRNKSTYVFPGERMVVSVSGAALVQPDGDHRQTQKDDSVGRGRSVLSHGSGA